MQQKLDTLPDFIAYFRELAEANLALGGSFVHGATSRIISGSRSDIKYPCLWLETPTLALSEKDGTTAPEGKRQCAWVVLQSVPANDPVAEDAGWASSEQIALDMLSRMIKDRKARKFGFELNDKPLEPIATLTVDNEIGWRYEFELSSYVSVKYDPARWQPAG
jgi:hypothetical protein